MKKESALSYSIRMLGLTQKEVAKKLDITESTITNWNKGNHIISPKMVQALKELGIPLEVIGNPSKTVEL